MKKQYIVGISFLFFCIGYYIYGMDQQHVRKIPTLLSLALTECLSNGSIDNVFYQLKRRNIYISKQEFKNEIMQAIQRDPVKMIYNRLPEDQKRLFFYQQNKFSEQIQYLTMNIQMSDGFVMHTTEYYQQRALLAELIAKCVVLNVDCSTSLHYGYSDYTITKLLLECSANPDIKNDKGKTPLYCAVEHYYGFLLGGWSRLRAINELLKHRADPSFDIIQMAGKKRYSFRLKSGKVKIPNSIEFLLISYKWPRAWKIMKITFFASLMAIGLMIYRILAIARTA